MITVIIPTLRKSDKLQKMLHTYSNEVDEVIIIDNASTSKFDKKEGNVRTISAGENIYVNPAWNWGVREAKNDIVFIINDDVYIKDFKKLMDYCVAFLEEYRLLGMHSSNFSYRSPFNPKIQEVKSLCYGFGTFMAMRKSDYIMIPDSIKIWRGDHIQLTHSKSSKPAGAIMGVSVETKMSTTVNSSHLFRKQCDRDIIEYRKIYA